MEGIRVREQKPRCPYCHDDIGQGKLVACSCGALHHDACATELQKCGACSYSFNTIDHNQHQPQENTQTLEAKISLQDEQRKRLLPARCESGLGALILAGIVAFGTFSLRNCLEQPKMQAQYVYQTLVKNRLNNSFEFPYEAGGVVRKATISVSSYSDKIYDKHCIEIVYDGKCAAPNSALLQQYPESISKVGNATIKHYFVDEFDYLDFYCEFNLFESTPIILRGARRFDADIVKKDYEMLLKTATEELKKQESLNK